MENKKLKVKDIVLFIIFLIFLILEIYLIIAWIPVNRVIFPEWIYPAGFLNRHDFSMGGLVW